MCKKIDLQDFVHPMDQALTEKIKSFPVVKQLLDFIFEKKMDAVNYYLYNSSCIKLYGDHPAVEAFRDGCNSFCVDAANNVYAVRSYDFDVKVVGYTEPIILVSSRLIQENDAYLLRERTATAAADIAAEHHKLDFLLWVYDNFSGLINLPLLSTMLAGLISEWQRSRQYTLDRSFLLYTEDYELAKKNILYGSIPYNILKNFEFGEGDTYSNQVTDFYRKDGALDTAASVYSVLQQEIWIPARYNELCKFYLGGENHGMEL